MSGLFIGIISGVSWCFCSACASLCSSWCGNDKPSTTPPSATSGRRRSVLLLALSVVLSLAFQYGVAPRLQQGEVAADAPYIGRYLVEQWTAGCGDAGELGEACSGNAGVYRASSAAFLFFVVFGVAAKCRPTSNREAWPAKYVLYLFLSAGTVFLSNEPLFLPLYLNVARAGSVLFVLFQQLVLVDVAYNWNESWVAKADRAEADEGPGQGKKWLVAILVSCGILYAGSLAAIVLMYLYFGGCGTNEAFISVTLALSLICTLIQLTISHTGSLLTSAAMTAYATYLCATAVAKNPNAECNPKLGEPSTWSIVLGLFIATISLLWTGWSSTADKRVGGNTETDDDDDDRQGAGTSTYARTDEDDQEKTKVGGIVTNDPNYGSAEAEPPESANSSNNDVASNNPSSFGNSWKLNAVLALVCCWYSMALTGWGSIEKRGDIANPDVGEVSMWMLIVSQWVALLLYLWTLVAPTLFPDRDFS